MPEVEQWLFVRSASTYEPNGMIEPMDVDSEHKHLEPKTRHEDNTTLDFMQIDSEDTTARVSVKSTFGPRAFSKLPTDRVGLEHSQTRKNSASIVSCRRAKSQKVQGQLGTSTTQNFKQHTPIHHQKWRLPKSPGKDLEKIRKRKLARVTSLSHRLVGNEPLNSFAENCQKTIADWISLLSKTTLPSDIESSDLCIITAFKAVDSVICGNQGTYLLRRLAYIQLMRLFASLEAIIKSERDTGRIFREPGYGNASIAIDIYMSAQESHLHPDDLRRELRERKRTGRRWRDLASLSPPFVLMYSEASEPIV
ncbi:hypothetical protein CEP51_013191 [Fusarium floridanum]|uniref:Uncharacterized protein n=1 Tax=Fusarium floridanum TaxID=1325733 RepID=A0A428QFX3_9HYPO|nr:hypothetical protein CEP51_013191 [Fusarium floridanum]